MLATNEVSNPQATSAPPRRCWRRHDPHGPPDAGRGRVRGIGTAGPADPAHRAPPSSLVPAATDAERYEVGRQRKRWRAVWRRLRPGPTCDVHSRQRGAGASGQPVLISGASATDVGTAGLSDPRVQRIPAYPTCRHTPSSRRTRDLGAPRNRHPALPVIRALAGEFRAHLAGRSGDRGPQFGELATHLVGSGVAAAVPGCHRQPVAAALSTASTPSPATRARDPRPGRTAGQFLPTCLAVADAGAGDLVGAGERHPLTNQPVGYW